MTARQFFFVSLACLFVSVFAARNAQAEEAEARVVPTPTSSPISREALSALMKHPTEPQFDPLRPMSGRWVRCRENGADPASGSIQDRYSSSDHTHFTHTILKASDNTCKTILSEERTSYECTSVSKETLSCKVLKRESKTGDGVWATMKAPDKLTTSESANSEIKLSFVGLPSKKQKRSKHRSKTAPSAEDLSKTDGRKLELHIEPEGGTAESIHLDFVPTTPHTKKHAADTDS